MDLLVFFKEILSEIFPPTIMPTPTTNGREPIWTFRLFQQVALVYLVTGKVQYFSQYL